MRAAGNRVIAPAALETSLAFLSTGNQAGCSQLQSTLTYPRCGKGCSDERNFRTNHRPGGTMLKSSVDRYTELLVLPAFGEFALQASRDEQTIRRRDAVLRVELLAHLPLLAVGRLRRIALAALGDAEDRPVAEEHRARAASGTGDLLVDASGFTDDFEAVDQFHVLRSVFVSSRAVGTRRNLVQRIRRCTH